MMPILTLLIVPLIAAIVSWISRSYLLLNTIAIVATGIELGAALALAKRVSYATVDYTSAFSIDALSAVVILTVAIIGFFTALYSVGYLREEVAKGIIGFRRVRQYFALVHLFLLAMFFACATTAPILMWIAIEATTLATAFLVSFYNKRSAMEAAWKYLIINSVGLLLGFLGTLLFFTAFRGESGATFVTWDMLRASAIDPMVVHIGFVLVLIGYGTKIGLVPMHTWKPDAYSKAPTPVVALFSGALLNVALLALLRFKGVTDLALGTYFTQHLFIGFGLLTILVAALIIFTQWNYKRLLAYSSIEHAGIMVLGFGFGGLGAFAALLHMLYHSLAKSSLFFSTGNIFLKYSSTKIDNVRGLLTTLPTTTVLFFIGFLAVVGLPPFGIFTTELYIVLAGIATHPYVTSVAMFGLVLVFVGFLRHLTRLAYGEPPHGLPAGESNYLTILPSFALLVILVALGFYLPAGIQTLLQTAAHSL